MDMNTSDGETGGKGGERVEGGGKPKHRNMYVIATDHTAFRFEDC